MGAMLGFIALNFLPKYDLHYEQLFSYQPSLFKFLLLPTIVFAGSYRADARALFLEAGQAISFGIFGTIISILVIGDNLFHRTNGFCFKRILSQPVSSMLLQATACSGRMTSTAHCCTVSSS